MGFGKDGKGVIITEQRSQALSTLAAQTALLIGTKLAMDEDFRMLKAQVHCHISSLDAGDANKLILGLADGNLTVGQIGEAILAAGPLNPNEQPEAERAMRPVFWVGAIALGSVFKDINTNSPICVVKPRWTFQDTESWNWFVYNQSAGALTTGATALLITKCFGVWVQ